MSLARRVAAGLKKGLVPPGLTSKALAALARGDVAAHEEYLEAQKQFWRDVGGWVGGWGQGGVWGWGAESGAHADARPLAADA